MGSIVFTMQRYRLHAGSPAGASSALRIALVLRLTRLGLALLVLSTPLLALAGCKNEAPSESDRASPLAIRFTSVDTSFAPRGERPFIAGELARITLSIKGGRPPYDLQLLTSAGNPKLASGESQLAAEGGAAFESGIDLELSSEVPSGTYGLAVRITDQDGHGASARSSPFEVLGADVPVMPPTAETPHLQVVDVAGRARKTFYQGEEIRVRASFRKAQTIALGIIAEDERPFMPMRSYELPDKNLDLALRVPRLARVGRYRIDIASDSAEASVPLHVVGKSFPPAGKLLLAELHLWGGKDRRAPRTGVIRRGEALQVEAQLGGIKQEASALLRLRNRTGQIVAKHELASITIADPHPRARALLSQTWTPPATLPRGRHMLEIEVSEQDDVATLYREIVLR